MGMADKCARTFLGAICIAVYFLRPATSYILALVGVLLILSVIISICPAYILLGLSTAEQKKAARKPAKRKAKKRSRKK